MTKKSCVVIGALLLAALLLSCDNYFSSSWGTARSYDSSNIDVSAANVDSWIEKAMGNPELAAAVTEKIIDELRKGILNREDEAKLQNAGVSLAIESSGIGQTIISNAGGAVSGLSNNPAALPDLMGELQDDFRARGGDKAAANIATIVGGSLERTPGAYHSGDVPRFKDNSLYAENTNPTAVGQAVVILALAVTGENDMQNVDLAHLDDYGIAVDNGKAVVANNATAESIALAAYLNLIAEDKGGKYTADPITNSIKIAFLGA
jgi:hypothetical protein